MWVKIIYHYFIQKTHIVDVMCKRVCLINSLICDDIEVNIGAVIFLMMRKMCFYQGHRYGFGGLLTRFLMDHGVKEEVLDYRLVVDTNPIDVSHTKGITVTHGTVLTMPKRQAE